jgi:hypothetical protein
MQQRCQDCGKTFDLPETARFCPYCGKSPQSEIQAGAATGSFGEVLERNALAEQFTACFDTLSALAAAKLKEIAACRPSTEYQSKYARVKRAQTRQSLLAEVQAVLNGLESMIDLPDGERLQAAADLMADADAELREKLDALCAVAGYTAPAFDAENKQNSAAIRYTARQLRDFYELLPPAYEKYRLCVEENNMFAAFSSNSDYGLLENRFFTPLFNLDADVAKIGGDTEDADYEAIYREAAERLRESNARPYRRLLDEDFLPHVDAFWAGLEDMANFLDNRFELSPDELLALLAELPERRDGVLRRARTRALPPDTWERLREIDRRNRRELGEK